jgi:GDP-L-fucose synthase
MKVNRVFVAGQNGMVGSSITRQLKKNNKIILISKNRDQLDFVNQNEVLKFFKTEKIDQVYIAAAKVGGIKANIKSPADFIYENILIQSNIIHSAYITNVKKLIFIGSSSIYPGFINKPMKEKDIFSGPLETSTAPYAIAKIAGIKMCESFNSQFKKKKLKFISLIPTNLYGPNDNFCETTGHVVPSLIRKFYEAQVKNKKKIILWGSGKALREFLYVDDFAKACIFIMNQKKKINNSFINVGSGEIVNIKTLALIIKNIVGYKGIIKFDKKKIDGIKNKSLNSKIIYNLGWKPNIKLVEGLKLTFDHFKRDYEKC